MKNEWYYIMSLRNKNKKLTKRLREHTKQEYLKSLPPPKTKGCSTFIFCDVTNEGVCGRCQYN